MNKKVILNQNLLNNNLLIAERLYKTYQEKKLQTKVLRGVSFSLKKGDMMAIIGSSGSGKSTLLHLLNGLDIPTKGNVIFNGQLVNQLPEKQKTIMRNRDIGFIYQFHHLLPDFNALENIAMPLLISGIKPKDAKQRAIVMLKSVGLLSRAQHRPAELSGGERQRVAIGRALINNPLLVIADEPTGNLDRTTANNVFEMLLRLNKELGTAFLVVTHDLALAKRLNIQLELRDGRLSEIMSSIE